MDADEPLAGRGDPLAQLAREDLDPLSVAELEARIARLEAEVARCHRHSERAADHRATADQLFRR